MIHVHLQGSDEWVREGECNRCGACCKVIDMIGKKYGTCALYAEADGVGCCTDRQHPYYLRKCINWPTTPQQIAPFPQCSYTFRRKDDQAPRDDNP